MFQKVFLYIFFTALFIFGIFLMFRGRISPENMIRVEGKILQKSISTTYTLKGRVRYSLAFQIDSEKNLIGIPLGTSKKNGNGFNFDTGKVYKFYINPTYPLMGNINNGIEKIEHEGNTVYKKSETASLIFGFLLSLVSLITIIYSIITFNKMRIKETTEFYNS